MQKSLLAIFCDMLVVLSMVPTFKYYIIGKICKTTFQHNKWCILN